jgi:hypothetical protein
MMSHVSSLPTQNESATYCTRRFTEHVDDLNIDFTASRPELITRLLNQCLSKQDGNTFESQFFWGMTVAERLQALISIACNSIGNTTTAVADCCNEVCKEKIELELELSSFVRETPRKIDWLSPDQQTFVCRLPTGMDQQAWYEHAKTLGAIDESWLANRLLEENEHAVPSSLPDVWLQPLATALEAADPLTVLAIDVQCPFCDKPVCVEVDLEFLLLEGLRTKQRRMIEQIHRIARHYHWNETDIIAIPQWRRDRYLSRIAAEYE